MWKFFYIEYILFLFLLFTCHFIIHSWIISKPFLSTSYDIQSSRSLTPLLPLYSRVPLEKALIYDDSNNYDNNDDNNDNNHNRNENNVMDSSLFDRVSDSLRYFREYVKRGMIRMKSGNFVGALEDFNRAANLNTSQPLAQRGVLLYCIGDYENAEKQFDKDILLLESMKVTKASDFRLWRSACFNKMNRTKEAQRAITAYLPEEGLSEPRYLINATLNFYSGQNQLLDILEIMEECPDNDLVGTKFFGNFYLGLYFDSIYDIDAAKGFLSFPGTSNRYPVQDMWYHVPRILYSKYKNYTT